MFARLYFKIYHKWHNVLRQPMTERTKKDLIFFLLVNVNTHHIGLGNMGSDWNGFEWALACPGIHPPRVHKKHN